MEWQIGIELKDERQYVEQTYFLQWQWNQFTTDDCSAQISLFHLIQALQEIECEVHQIQFRKQKVKCVKSKMNRTEQLQRPCLLYKHVSAQKSEERVGKISATLEVGRNQLAQ